MILAAGIRCYTFVLNACAQHYCNVIPVLVCVYGVYAHVSIYCDAGEKALQPFKYVMNQVMNM